MLLAGGVSAIRGGPSVVGIDGAVPFGLLTFALPVGLWLCVSGDVAGIRLPIGRLAGRSLWFVSGLCDRRGNYP